MDDHPATIGALGIEAGGSGFAVVQVTAVLQDADVGINSMPQLVAQGRAEVLHNKFVTGLKIPAAAAAFGDGQLYFFHIIPIKNARIAPIAPHKVPPSPPVSPQIVAIRSLLLDMRARIPPAASNNSEASNKTTVSLLSYIVFWFPCPVKNKASNIA